MLTIFFASATAYFLVQGVIGCMFLSVLLQIKHEQRKLSGFTMAILSGLLYCLTIGGIFAQVMVYANYKADVTEEMEVVFSITGFAMLGLLFVIAREWNQLLQKLK